MARTSGMTTNTSQNTFVMKRSQTSAATFTFNSDPDRPWVTQITVPAGSTWSADAHWHERYAEYLIVSKGRALVHLNDESRIVTSDDGPQLVDRFVVHEWMRADKDTVEKDEDELIVEEWTDPADGLKQVFFRNLLGVVNDGGRYWRSWLPIQALLICNEYDNYNVFVSGKLSHVTTYSIFTTIRGLSRLLGLKPWYPEYTPEVLRDIAESKALSSL